MNTVKLNPFLKPDVQRKFSWQGSRFELLEEQKVSFEEQVQGIQGTCTTLQDKFIAVFSFDNENYLVLDHEVIPFTQALSLEHQCAEDYEKSFIKIKKHDQVIFEVYYVNPHEPISLDFVEWSTTNFAFHLARYFNQVRSNPRKPIFESL